MFFKFLIILFGNRINGCFSINGVLRVKNIPQMTIIFLLTNTGYFMTTEFLMTIRKISGPKR